MKRVFSIYSPCILFSLIFAGLIIHGCTRSEKQRTGPQTGTPAKSYPFWAKIYNISGQDELYSVHQTTDGGFIAAGKTNFRRRDPDALIVKLDAGGNVQWQRGFGEIYRDEFFDAQQTRDGGYLAIGNTLGTGTMAEPGTNLAMIIKLNAYGEVLWQKVISRQLFQSFVQAADGDFVVTGTAPGFGSDGGALLIARFDPDGRNRWYKIYGDGHGTIIQLASDGGYVVIGWVSVPGGSDTLILKLDADGTVQWERQYRGLLTAVEQIRDGGYLFAGTISMSVDKDQMPGLRLVLPNQPPSIVNVDGWLLKLDHDGHDEWQKTYGGVFEEQFSVMQRTSDGNLVVLGNTKSYGAGYGDLWLLKLDETGNILWQKTIGGTQRDVANEVRQTSDGGHIIAGITASFGRGSENPFLMKMNDTGDIPGCTLPVFGVASSAPNEVTILRSNRRILSSGQDISHIPTNASIPSFDILISPAGICPPEPKIVLSSASLKLGSAMQNDTRRSQMRVMNTGAVDLTINEVKVTKNKRGGWFPLRNIWAMITGTDDKSAELFNIENNNCTVLSPGRDCAFTVVFKSSTAGEKQATLEIISNDPETPVRTVPINATVVRGINKSNIFQDD